MENFTYDRMDGKILGAFFEFMIFDMYFFIFPCFFMTFKQNHEKNMKILDFSKSVLCRNSKCYSYKPKFCVESENNR